MTYDPLYFELFDESAPTPTRGTPAQSPLDREMFPFEKSTGAGELLAAQLEHRHFVAEMLGTEVFAKRVPSGLFEITPSAIRPPISPNSYQQESLPVPEEMDESGVQPCECKCARCQKDNCKNCAAEKKCANCKCEDAAKAVAGLIGQLQGRLHPHGRTVSKETWRQLEAAMTRYITKAIASVV